MTRTVSGSGWDIVGRPLSSLTMQLLSGGRFLQDLSPVTQALGAIIITLAAYILSLSFFKEGSIKLLRILFILIIALNPYMLEMYSYRYDSLPYAIGFFLAALAHLTLFDFVFSPQSNEKLPAVLSLACAAALCLCVGTLFYQPILTVFLVAGAFKLFILAISEPLSVKLKKLSIAFLSTIGSSLLTAKIFNDLLINSGDWAAGQGQFTLSKIVTNLYMNTLKAWKIFQADWATPQNIFFLFAVMTLLNILVMVVAYIYITVKTNGISRSQLGQYLFSTLWLVTGCCLGLYGLTAILDKPHMKPRTFIALGVTLAIPLLLPYTLGLAKNLYIKKYLTIVGFTGALSVVIFALIWGNAIAAQNLYQNAVIWQLAQDIYSSEKVEAKVAFENTIGFSPLISKTTLEKYPLLQRLLGRHPSSKWAFGYIGLRSKTGLSLTAADNCSRGDKSLLVDRISYTIRDCNSELLVSFK